MKALQNLGYKKAPPTIATGPMKPGQFRTVLNLHDGTATVEYELLSDRGLEKDEIFKRLVAIAKMPSGAHATLLHGDRIDQEQLNEVQEKLSDLLVDLGNEIPGGAALLQKELPYDFETTTKKPKGGR